MSRRVLLSGRAAPALAAPLSEQGWTMADPGGHTPVDLLVAWPSVPVDAAWVFAAMDTVADVLDNISRARDRLAAAHGLALVVVDDPPERAPRTHPARGVVSAAVAMGLQVLAADWDSTARCLLAVAHGADVDQVVRLADWLTLPDAPRLTGQTVDLAALRHATLRTTD